MIGRIRFFWVSRCVKFRSARGVETEESPGKARNQICAHANRNGLQVWFIMMKWGNQPPNNGNVNESRFIKTISLMWSKTTFHLWEMHLRFVVRGTTRFRESLEKGSFLIKSIIGKQKELALKRLGSNHNVGGWGTTCIFVNHLRELLLGNYQVLRKWVYELWNVVG